MLLKKEIQELEEHLKNADKINLSVSQKGVDWHIDHTLRVINGVGIALKTSNPDTYKWKFNWVRTYIFLIGYIPRGKGRAPKSVVAHEEIQIENLKKNLLSAKEILQEIDTLPSNSNFKHPYFGILNLKMTIKFLRIHTRHHLKIMDDIVREQ